MSLPFAENCSYWQTSRSGADSWIQKTRDLITKFGGSVISQVSGEMNGRKGIMIEFEINGDRYRIAWPVLDSKFRFDSRNKEGAFNLSASRQAATFIYHDVKAKMLAAQVLGAKQAFVQYRVTSGGDTVAEFMDQENIMPPLIESK